MSTVGLYVRTIFTIFQKSLGRSFHENLTSQTTVVQPQEMTYTYKQHNLCNDLSARTAIMCVIPQKITPPDNGTIRMIKAPHTPLQTYVLQTEAGLYALAQIRNITIRGI
jgi:hypothetical protein